MPLLERKSDQGRFTPPFPPSNGRASGGVAPPPSAMDVNSSQEGIQIKRGSCPLFATPMAEQRVAWPRLQSRFDPKICIHAPPPVYKRGEYKAAVWGSLFFRGWCRLVAGLVSSLGSSRRWARATFAFTSDQASQPFPSLDPEHQRFHPPIRAEIVPVAPSLPHPNRGADQTALARSTPERAHRPRQGHGVGAQLRRRCGLPAIASRGRG